MEWIFKQVDNLEIGFGIYVCSRFFAGLFSCLFSILCWFVASWWGVLESNLSGSYGLNVCSQFFAGVLRVGGGGAAFVGREPGLVILHRL